MMWKSLIAASALALTTAAAQAEKVQIELWHAMGGALGEATNELAEQFNASQDEYELTPIYRGNYEETLTATIAAFRAGEQPNIVQVFDAGAATIIGAKGAVIPAQDLIEQAGLEFRDDYIPGVANFYADEDGKMIGMPFNSSTPILYYNIEALQAAGVEPPRTWEEFEQSAPRLRDAGYVPLANSHLPWVFTENFMSRHNLQFATNDNGYTGAQGTELLVNVEPIKMHFGRVKEWIDNDLYGYYGSGWDDNQTPFETGQVAMWLGSSGSFGGLRQSTNFAFSSTFLPYWQSVTEEPYHTFIGGAALFAMTGHDRAENEATAAFFEFMSSADPQVFWHKATGYVPITTEAYEQAKAEGYYDEMPSAETGILQLLGRPGEWNNGYRMGFYVQIRDVMYREFGRIFAGQATVDGAFDIIEREGNRLLARFAQTQKGG